MKIGLLPLARPTFDVPYATEKLAEMLALLDKTGHEIIGPRKLLMAPSSEALEAIKDADLILVLQVTFTDAAFVVEASGLGVPMAIWAVPEPRTGGRLRLNAFCGLNLASHALGRNNVDFGWLYADAHEADIAALLDGNRKTSRLDGGLSGVASVPIPFDDLKIARIGAHPVGFDTCAYDNADLKALTGARVDELELEEMFDIARGLDTTEINHYRDRVAELDDIDAVDAGELDRSLRLAGALDKLRRDNSYDAFALRCWPETFTEYGGAMCGPASILGENKVPCACEADVYGAVTQAILQGFAQQPVFLADIVDISESDNTGVVWHCGQAPISMSEGGGARATVHTNRKQALLYEFALKAGRVTLFRLSQAFGEPRIVIATGEMLKRDRAFTGTSGVIRFDYGADLVLRDMMNSGLEHHMAIAYGDHAEKLRGLATGMKLRVVELGDGA